MRRAHLRAQPGKSVPASHRKEFAAMNWTTFFAMLARDAHVARRNLVALMLQTMLQPMLFVFVFGKVMTTSGMMPSAYKGMLIPGIMGMSMVMTGIQAVAMPLIGELQFTREIEARWLAPTKIGGLAGEKILAGAIQALAGHAGAGPAPGVPRGARAARG